VEFGEGFVVEEAGAAGYRGGEEVGPGLGLDKIYRGFGGAW
jgi:hypothetical protein